MVETVLPSLVLVPYEPNNTDLCGVIKGWSDHPFPPPILVSFFNNGFRICKTFVQSFMRVPYEPNNTDIWGGLTTHLHHKSW